MGSRFSSGVPAELRAEFVAARRRTNLSRMFYFSAVVFFVQLVLNIINMTASGTSEGLVVDPMVYVALSVSLLLVSAVLFFLFRSARRDTGGRRVPFLIISYLTFFVLIQLAFLSLNLLSGPDLYSYFIAILVVGLVVISVPSVGVGAIVFCLLYTLGIAFFYQQAGLSDSFSQIFHSDAWTGLIIITGIVVCFSIFSHRMFVSDFLARMQLERNNEQLESAVFERTRDLRAQTEAAQVASRTKSEFLARMSHEIRTPLNAITGMTKVAARSLTEPKTLEALEQIDKASLHLLDILSDVLDMSNIESGDFTLSNEPFSLSACLLDVADAISLRCARAGLDFSVDIGGVSSGMVMGDRLRFRQVLVGLLGNAVKFTPEGGEVSFIARDVSESERFVRVHFTVADNGIGMSREQIDRLFTAFDQGHTPVSSRLGGIGLGLAISQNIVRQMGGVIEVESGAGEGSVFTFEVEFPKSSEADSISDGDAVPDFSGRRVLVAEDIEINRFILSELLADTNILIEEASDGRHAVNMFARSKVGYYDLIIMDIQMPRLDGYAATREIRAMEREDAGLPILAMTANAFQEDAVSSLEAGMNFHIAKPVNTRELFAALVRFLPPKA